MNTDDTDQKSTKIRLPQAGIGLLDKTNPNATWKSVAIHALIGAVVVSILFLVVGKPSFREEWRLTVPLTAVLGAFVAAICEWQVADSDTDEDLADQHQ